MHSHNEFIRNVKTMQSFEDVVIVGNTVSAVFATSSPAYANMLRRSIMSEIETYAIDVAVFHVNTSPRHDELIALRLGQLVIDNMQFHPPADRDMHVTVDVVGPYTFTTDDIQGVPFTFRTPIVDLRQGQRISCELIIKKGTGREHVKWRPVASCRIEEFNDKYKIIFKEIGMLSGPEILRRGFENMDVAARRPAINQFFEVLVPQELVTTE